MEDRKPWHLCGPTSCQSKNHAKNLKVKSKKRTPRGERRAAPASVDGCAPARGALTAARARARVQDATPPLCPWERAHRSARAQQHPLNCRHNCLACPGAPCDLHACDDAQRGTGYDDPKQPLFTRQAAPAPAQLSPSCRMPRSQVHDRQARRGPARPQLWTTSLSFVCAAGSRAPTHRAPL